ncbi:hypothetical protein PLICRDRAFT_683700 [Plicaturopsis crispa FD-325 SS-3]|nr:hypothetical protein PLICRDRAFT_683700 [Plicaturopsis crispa FD-325 SS-3]
MLLQALALAAAASACVVAAAEVKIGNTTVVGLDLSESQQEFYGGIPFAEPPVGNLRFQPPKLLTALNTTSFAATGYGPACIQPSLALSQISEDCLTINVQRPAGVSMDARLPVMVYFYGGSFTTGSADQFNATGIVGQAKDRGTPIIYVNFNYRLGPFGFPQGSEASSKGALNLGLKDQLAALTWIQTNIGAFGGDKSQVTIFGASAGAISQAILFFSPNFSQLARAAIFESGSAATFPINYPTVQESAWQNFVLGVPSCALLTLSNSTFDCLRAANWTELVQGERFALNLSSAIVTWPPVIDGSLFPDYPSKLIAKGQYAKLPFISGTNVDEGTGSLDGNITYTTLILRVAIVGTYSPALEGDAQLDSAIDKLLQLYPDDPSIGSPYGTGNQTFGTQPGFKRAASLIGDLAFQSKRRAWIQAASNASVKTYSYLFTDPQTTSEPRLGVFHGSEVAYVYGSPAGTDSAKGLSKQMVDYWVSFATSLDPNDGKGTNRPLWPEYTPESQVLLQLNGQNLTVIPDTYRDEGIAFINSDPATFHAR